MSFDDRAELLREISARGGPTVDGRAGDAGAMLLLRDLAERGLVVQTGIEGSQVAVTAGPHSRTGDDHLTAAAGVWLAAAEAEGWGSHAAEVLRLQRQIRELEGVVGSLRTDLLILSNAGLDAAGSPQGRSLHLALNDLKIRALNIQERHKLR